MTCSKHVLAGLQAKNFKLLRFQAVNAEPLDGETIHKALGLSWHGNDHNVAGQRILDLARQAVQWRWLLLDEISMVSAEMLARLEARCRQLVLDLSATKYGKHTPNCIAPFGGLNVILSGDLWQLPPPRGNVFSVKFPWHLVTGVPSKKLPLSLQGQQIVWASSVQGGLQGVTETNTVRTNARCLATGAASRTSRRTLIRRQPCIPTWADPQEFREAGAQKTQQPTCGENTCYRLYKNGFHSSSNSQIRMCNLSLRTRQ